MHNNVDNIAKYGLLYNWFVVDNSRNIAPAGWHVPTDEEWKQLELYLGLSQMEADSRDFRGTNEGDNLKAANGWYKNGSGNNQSGFSALPGGHRWIDGGFYGIDSLGTRWSSTEFNSTDAWVRRLDYSSSGINRGSQEMKRANSIRCVKD